MYHDQRISERDAACQHPAAAHNAPSAQTTYGHQQPTPPGGYGQPSQTQQSSWGNYPATQYGRPPAQGSQMYMSTADNGGMNRTVGLGNTAAVNEGIHRGNAMPAGGLETSASVQTGARNSTPQGSSYGSDVGRNYVQQYSQYQGGSIVSGVETGYQIAPQAPPQQQHHYYPAVTSAAQTSAQAVPATSVSEYHSTGYYRPSPPHPVVRPVNRDTHRYQAPAGAVQSRTPTPTQPGVPTTSSQSYGHGGVHALADSQYPSQSMYAPPQPSPRTAQAPAQGPKHAPAPDPPESRSQYKATQMARNAVQREIHEHQQQRMHQMAMAQNHQSTTRAADPPARAEPAHRNFELHTAPHPQTQTHAFDQQPQHRSAEPTTAHFSYDSAHSHPLVHSRFQHTAPRQPEPSHQYIQPQYLHNRPLPLNQREPTPEREAQPEEQSGRLQEVAPAGDSEPVALEAATPTQPPSRGPEPAPTAPAQPSIPMNPATTPSTPRNHGPTAPQASSAPVTGTVPAMPVLDPNTPVDASTMEAHMRQMVDAMRFFQQKDPSTFHNIWESVRKDSATKPAITEKGETGQANAPQARTPTPRARPAEITGTSAPRPAVRPSSVPAGTSPQPTLGQQAPAPAPSQAPQSHPHPSHTSSGSGPTLSAPSSAAMPPQGTFQTRITKISYEPMAIASRDFFANLGIAIDVDALRKILTQTQQFVTLCEYFERQGYKFDRGQYAKHLLASTKKTPITTSQTDNRASAPQEPTPSLQPQQPQGEPQLHPQHSSASQTPIIENVQSTARPGSEAPTVHTAGRILGEVDDAQEQLMNETRSSTHQAMDLDPSHRHSPRIATPTAPIYQQPVYGVPNVAPQNSAADPSIHIPGRKPLKRPRKDGLPPGSIKKGSRTSLIVKLPLKRSSAMQYQQYNHYVNGSEIGTPPSVEHMNEIHPPPQQGSFQPQQGSQIFGPYGNPIHQGQGAHPSQFLSYGNAQQPIVLDNSPVPSPQMRPQSQMGHVPIHHQGASDGSIRLDGSPAHFGPYQQPYITPGVPQGSDFIPSGQIPHASGQPPLVDLSRVGEQPKATPPPLITLPPRKKIIDPKLPLAEPIRRENAKRCSKYRSTNVARDLLVVIGRHPTERPLNDHLRPLKENLPGHVSLETDLSTIKWDVLDPKPLPGEEEEVARSGNIETGRAYNFKVPLTVVSSGKKRGRPPKNAVQTTTPNGAVPTSAPELMQPGYHATDDTTSEPRRLESLFSPAPSAIRDDMTSPHPSKRQRTGDGPQPQPSTARTPASAVFKQYPCYWERCAARLHNWDTLKRHVVKVHKRATAAGKYPCNWIGCVAATDPAHPDFEFESSEHWDEHTAEHLVEVKNVLGLGPSVLPAGTPSTPSPSSLPKSGTRRKSYTYHTPSHAPLDSADPPNTNVNFLADRATGQQITPLAGPAPEGFHFETPPGHKANRLWNETHDVPSTKRKKQLAQEVEYRKALERGRKLGAGIEGDPWEGRLEVDDGLGVKDATFKVVSASWP